MGLLLVTLIVMVVAMVISCRHLCWSCLRAHRLPEVAPTVATRSRKQYSWWLRSGQPAANVLAWRATGFRSVDAAAGGNRTTRSAGRLPYGLVWVGPVPTSTR